VRFSIRRLRGRIEFSIFKRQWIEYGQSRGYIGVTGLRDWHSVLSRDFVYIVHSFHLSR